MPKYEYECSECEFRKTIVHSPHRRITDCPSCGSVGTMKMVFNTPTVFGRSQEEKETKMDRQSVERRLTQHIDETKNDLEELKSAYKNREFEK